MLSERGFELAQKSKQDLTLSELVELVLEMNTPTEIPPCRVCGAELEIGAAGGGYPTRYHCGSANADVLKHKSGTREYSEAFEHYSESTFEDRRSVDPWAYELAKRLNSDSMIRGFLKIAEV
jgi:hypothetical protein